MASSSHDNSINFYDVNEFVKKRMNFVEESTEEASLEVNMDMEESESKAWEMQNASEQKAEEGESEDFESDDSSDSD